MPFCLPIAAGASEAFAETNAPGLHAQVYVIVYGEGEGASEGIYSLRSDADANGLVQDTIIAFESRTDAERTVCHHPPDVVPYVF